MASESTQFIDRLSFYGASLSLICINKYQGGKVKRNTCENKKKNYEVRHKVKHDHLK